MRDPCLVAATEYVRTATSPLRRRVLAIGFLLIASPSVVACGSSDSPSVTGRSTDGPAAVTNDEAEISRVALSYVSHGFDDEAARLVAPESKEAFAYIKAAIPPGLRTTTKSLEAGAVTVSGSHATAVFKGTLCRTETGQPKQCVSNKDPRSTNPIFSVDLVKVDGAWRVTFPRPSGTYSESTSCGENGVEVPC